MARGVLSLPAGECRSRSRESWSGYEGGVESGWDRRLGGTNIGTVDRGEQTAAGDAAAFASRGRKRAVFSCCCCSPGTGKGRVGRWRRCMSQLEELAAGRRRHLPKRDTQGKCAWPCTCHRRISTAHSSRASTSSCILKNNKRTARAPTIQLPSLWTGFSLLPPTQMTPHCASLRHA